MAKISRNIRKMKMSSVTIQPWLVDDEFGDEKLPISHWGLSYDPRTGHLYVSHPGLNGMIEGFYDFERCSDDFSGYHHLSSVRQSRSIIPLNPGLVRDSPATWILAIPMTVG